MVRLILYKEIATGCGLVRLRCFLHVGLAGFKISFRSSNQEEVTPPNWIMYWNYLHLPSVICYIACRCSFPRPGTQSRTGQCAACLVRISCGSDRAMGWPGCSGL